MATKVEIRASGKEFARYRKLVNADWNAGTFNETLNLLWDVVTVPTGRESGMVADWIAALKTSHDGKLPPLPQKVGDVFATLTGFFHELRFPATPNDQSMKTSRQLLQADATTASLLLQFVCKLTGETGFFRDLQSLLFLNAVHYLLPQLEKQGATAAYANLVNALASHSVLIWWNEPSHMFYLRAAMMGQLGRRQERLECLHNALSATPISDHSYMTKANTYWGELLENGEAETALRWLVSLSRNVPESYAAEVAEMLAETAGAAALSTQP